MAIYRDHAILRASADRWTLKRFWSKVEKTNGCWLWTSAKSPLGYGRFMLCRGLNVPTSVLAHRMSWVIWNKRVIPKGKRILHRCDNPPCVRWSHLFSGTALQNSRDAVLKNRIATGERCGTSKLTWIEVEEIRKAHSGGQTKASIARSKMMSPAQIGDIILGRAWKRK